MRLNKLTGSLAAAAMTLGVFGVAAARTGGVLGTQAVSLFGAATAAVEAPREVDLPPEQQLSLALNTSLGWIRAPRPCARSSSRRALARDVVKTLCLNDKLNQIRRRGALRKGSGRPPSERSQLEKTRTALATSS